MSSSRCSDSLLLSLVEGSKVLIVYQGGHGPALEWRLLQKIGSLQTSHLDVDDKGQYQE